MRYNIAWFSDITFILYYFMLQDSVINWNKFPFNYFKDIYPSNIFMKAIVLVMRVI